MSNVVEVVHFSLDSDCTENDFLRTDEQMKQFLSQQAGLIHRSLSKRDDGSFVDIIYWQNMEAATSAQQSFYASDVCKLIGQLINIESVTIEHTSVCSTLGIN